MSNAAFNVSSSIVPPIWTSETCILLANYISRDLVEMQELYNDLAENAQDLLRIHSGTVSSITKERSKLEKILKKSYILFHKEIYLVKMAQLIIQIIILLSMIMKL